MITKSIQFAGAYRSSTFNDGPQNKFAGRNGVVDGGAVTTSGSIVTIQPLTWIQQGLFVTSDLSLSATLPAGLTAPYYVAVTSSNSMFNPGEVVTPTFVKRPLDVSAGTVLVAEWDGQEWRALPKIQIDELITSAQDRAVQADQVGIATGFDIALDGGDIVVQPGTLTDRQGALIEKTLAVTLTPVAADADGYDRIDEVIYGRPDEFSSRVGTIEYLVGQTFDPSDAVVISHDSQMGNLSATSNSVAKTLNHPTTNAVYFLFVELNAGVKTLKLRSAPDALTPVAAAVSLATGVDSFDAILNPEGSIDIVFAKSMDLRYLRVDLTGTVIYAESSTLSGADTVTLSNPKIVSLTSGSTYFLHIVYERAVSGSDHTLNYVRRSNLNTVETLEVLWVNLSDVVTNPSLEKDDQDSLLLLAFEVSTTQRVYLRTYDGSTPSSFAPPTQIGTPLELQDDTYLISSDTVVASTGATMPKVVRAPNQDTFVFWRHNKGAGVYGVAVYSRRFKAVFGHKAVIPDLTAMGESVDLYDAAVDALSTGHFIAKIGTNAIKSSYRLDTMLKLGVHGTVASAVTPTGVGTLFTGRGALIHTYSYAGGHTHFVKSTAGISSNLRGFYVPPTDVFLAHYRVSDTQLSVAGIYLEENTLITRLYEFMNCFAGGGQLSWQVAGSNKLVLTAAIPLRFYNRNATYTIPTNGPSGLTVGTNQVAYVVIPDEDVTQNLTLQVASFGSGVLDRYGKRAFPLFWNISGVLYLRFAPFRLSADGETIDLGDQVSLELLKWLSDVSSPIDSSPDPTNHNYSSIVGGPLLQSDGLNTAIGKLDAAIYALYILTTQLQMTQHESNVSKLRIANVDRTRTDGSIFSQELSSLILSFSGAVVNFSTGTILKEDDLTALGINFTPATITVGNYFWYGIGLSDNGTNAINQSLAQVSITPASASNAVQANAPLPLIAGTKKLGAILVQNIAGVVTVMQIRQLGAGSGSGSGGSTPPIIAQDFLGTGDGVTAAFTLAQTPLNDQSLLITVDGVYQRPVTDWSRSGVTVTLTTVPSVGQVIDAYYIVTGTINFQAFQEVPTGVVDGINDTFNLAGTPVTKDSVMIFVNGVKVLPSEWAFIQTISLTQIKFLAGSIPSPGQSLDVFFFQDVAATAPGGGGGGGGGFVVYGTAGAGLAVSAAGGVSINPTDQRQLRFLGSTGGIVNVTANPQIAAGGIIGQELLIVGTSDTDYIILQDGTGLSLNGPISLQNNVATLLFWNGGVWAGDLRR